MSSMHSPSIFALDPQLNESVRAEANGEVMPLALRRFQECWESRCSAGAIQRATEAVLAAYRQLFPGASPVIRVSRLCDIIGIRLTGLRPGRIKPSFAVAESSSRHLGHSGSVRFSRQGMPSIEIPEGVDGYRARVAAAHEIGHVLLHRRGDNYDPVTTRLPTSAQEEAIAEYAARLLLLPSKNVEVENLAECAVRWASNAEVTVHAATSRLGDPDQASPRLRGAVLWRLNPRVPGSSSLAERLTPAWHLCPGAFIPIGRCRARVDSVVAELANATAPGSEIRCEDVRIGSLVGSFRIHAFAWGSESAGTRLVLSVFQQLEGKGIMDAIPRANGNSDRSGVAAGGSHTSVNQQVPLNQGWF
jgi:hypothetical protein